MEERTVSAETGDHAYPIRIGKGLLNGTECFFEGKKVLLVSDSKVHPLHGEKAERFLMRSGADLAGTIIFPAGETSKNMTTVLEICRKAVQCGLDRKSVIAVLGGGVPGDLAGFASAIYMRGIAFCQIPTTLLAMVDSSVGGKTGADLPEGKNLIGAFHQPSAVLMDMELLDTLPEKEFRCGMAEIIKTAAILDEAFFRTLENNIPRILQRDPAFTAEMIARCCELKSMIVAKDEKESSLRAILNFGHTFGHAFECASDFTLPHGEAVAVGMNCVSQFAVRCGNMKEEIADRIEKLILANGLPSKPGPYDPEKIFSILKKDKKFSGGKLNFILVPQIGKAEIRAFPQEEEILAFLKEGVS